MSITVDFKNGQIEIKRGSQLVKAIPATNLFDIDPEDPKKPPSKGLASLVDVVKHNSEIRILDCKKDAGTGGIGLIDINLNLKSDKTTADLAPTTIYEEIPEVSFDNLHLCEDKVTEHFNESTTPISWAKTMLALEETKMLKQKVVFKESGVNPERFIKNPNYCFNFASEELDPLKRSDMESTQDKNPPDFFFPAVGEEIVFTTEFMSYLGMPKCSLRATRPDSGPTTKYNFEITVGGLVIDASNAHGINWFAGNAEKNKILKAALPTGAKRGPAFLKKQALIAVKEMGDLMQVIMMFVWRHLNDDKDYTMSTCDKVVFMVCMLMQVNCVFADTDKNELGKIISLLEFSSAMTNDPTVLKKMMKELYDKIKKQNEDLAEIIQIYVRRASEIIIVPKGPITSMKKVSDDPRVFIGAFISDFYKKDKTTELEVLVSRIIHEFTTESGYKKYEVLFADGSLGLVHEVPKIESLLCNPRFIVSEAAKLKWAKDLKESATKDPYLFDKIDRSLETDLDRELYEYSPSSKYAQPSIDTSHFPPEFYATILADIGSINQLLTAKFNGLNRTQISVVKVKGGEFQETSETILLKEFIKSMRGNFLVNNVFRPLPGFDNVVNIVFCKHLIVGTAEGFVSNFGPEYGVKTLYQLGLEMEAPVLPPPPPSTSGATARGTTARGATARRTTARGAKAIDASLVGGEGRLTSEEIYQIKGLSFDSEENYWFWKEMLPDNDDEINRSVVMKIKQECKDDFISPEYIVENGLFEKGILNRDGIASKYGFFNPMIILNNQIKDHLLNSGTEMYYDDVRSRLYDMFNVTGYVQYDGDLFGSIDKLISEITVDPIYGGQTRSEFSIKMKPLGKNVKSTADKEEVIVPNELEVALSRLTKRDQIKLSEILLRRGFDVQSLMGKLQNRSASDIYNMLQGFLSRYDTSSKKDRQRTAKSMFGPSIYAGLGGSATRKRGRTHKTKRSVRTNTRKSRS
jgi:hypothetical protein